MLSFLETVSVSPDCFFPVGSAARFFCFGFCFSGLHFESLLLRLASWLQFMVKGERLVSDGSSGEWAWTSPCATARWSGWALRSPGSGLLCGFYSGCSDYPEVSQTLAWK